MGVFAISKSTRDFDIWKSTTDYIIFAMEDFTYLNKENLSYKLLEKLI